MPIGLLMAAVALSLAARSVAPPTARTPASPVAAAARGVGWRRPAVASAQGPSDPVGISYLPALLLGGQFEPASPVPATSIPTTPDPTTPVPATSIPTTTDPATPDPATHVPATPMPATPDPGAGHYVSSTATASGDGSFDNPWSLQAALDHPAGLAPGDTVWLRGGTYTGTAMTDTSLGAMSFVCRTHGAPGAPISFRNYDDERVTIDGENNAIVLFVQGCSHTWFWGLEVMSSAPQRSPSRSYIYCTAPDIKFINTSARSSSAGLRRMAAATAEGRFAVRAVVGAVVGAVVRGGCTGGSRTAPTASRIRTT